MKTTSRFTLARFTLALAAAPLLFSSAVLAESACALPGLTVLEDPAGDFGGTFPVGSAEHDMTRLFVGQSEAGGETLIHFTLQTGGQPEAFLPRAVWYVSFQVEEAKYGVRLQTDDTAAVSIFSYSVANGGLQNDGVGDGRFVVAGSETPAQAGSGYDNGVLKVIVKASDIGLNGPGDLLYGFNAATIQGGQVPMVVSFAGTVDQMPDDLGREGFYEVKASGCESKSGLLGFVGGALPATLLIPFALLAALRRSRRA